MPDLFGPATTSDIRISDKIEALERELRMRRRVYPRWVEGGKMTQQLADRQILIFEAILADYEEQKHGDT